MGDRWKSPLVHEGCSPQHEAWAPLATHQSPPRCSTLKSWHGQPLEAPSTEDGCSPQHEAWMPLVIHPNLAGCTTLVSWATAGTHLLGWTYPMEIS